MEKDSIPSDITQCLDSKKVFIFSKSYCPYCDRAKGHLSKMEVPYEYVECDEVPLTNEQKDQLKSLSGITTFPNIFVGTKSIGGCDNMMKLDSTGELRRLLDAAGISYKK